MSMAFAVSSLNGPQIADLQGATPKNFVFKTVSVFPTEHEGLVIDLPDVTKLTTYRMAS